MAYATFSANDYANGHFSGTPGRPEGPGGPKDFPPPMSASLPCIPPGSKHRWLSETTGATVHPKWGVEIDFRPRGPATALSHSRCGVTRGRENPDRMCGQTHDHQCRDEGQIETENDSEPPLLTHPFPAWLFLRVRTGPLGRCASVGLRRRLTGRRFSPLKQQRVDQTADKTPDQWCQPEHPQLAGCAVPIEEGDARGPGRIDRAVTDRDGHQVDERQRQTDGQRPKSVRGPVVGRAQYHDEEERRQQDFGDDHRCKRVMAWRMRAVPVRGHIPGG